MPVTDVQSGVMEFLRCVNKAVRSVKMYSPNHPAVRGDVAQVFQALQGALQYEPNLVIGSQEGVLIVQNTPVEDKSLTVKTFIQAMRGKRIASFVVRKTVEQPEVEQLLRLFSMKDEDAVKDDALDPSLLEGLRNIRLNELKFKLVTDAEEAAGQLSPEQLQQLLSQDLSGFAKGGINLSSGEVNADMLHAVLSKLGGVAATEGSQAEIAVTTGFQQFEQVMENAWGSGTVRFGELMNKMLTAAQRMPEDQQKVIFGNSLKGVPDRDASEILKRFSPKFRARMIMTEVEKGDLGEGELKKVVDTLATDPEDYVSVLEDLTQLVSKTKGSLDGSGDFLSKIFKILQAGGAVREVYGKVLVIDGEKWASSQYHQVLQAEGYLVDVVEGGQEGLQKLLEQRGYYGLVIMDVKLPDINGLEVINRIYSEKMELPVIVGTKHETFRDAFEIVSYPKLKFFVKPILPDDLTAAVKEFLPAKSAEEVSDESELEKAKQIQGKLTPREAPQVDGYDLAWYYKPAKGIGGDYFDIFPLENGRYGMVVADVSGKGVPGAMVMVMTRSAFRLVGAFKPSARDALIEANTILKKDIPRGMFVSALYAVFDPSTRKVTIANAGHNAPLLWTKDFGFSQFLDISGTVLGVLDGDSFREGVGEESFELNPGDRLILYTDGVVEAMDPGNVEFGDKKLCQIVNFHSKHKSQELVDKLVMALESHRALAAQSDDITIFTLQHTLEAAQPQAAPAAASASAVATADRPAEIPEVASVVAPEESPPASSEVAPRSAQEAIPPASSEQPPDDSSSVSEDWA